MIQIQDHQIVPDSVSTKFSYEASDNHSGLFRSGLPDTIVIHYTAGASYNSSVSWLKDRQAKASAHLVVGRGGEVVQLVSFDTVAWHAGRSQWQGRTGLNQYSIGIEIANAGKLERRANGFYTSFGSKIADDKVVLTTHKHGDTEQAWEAFTPEQVACVEDLCIAIMNAYSIKDIVGHDDIAPGRKTDPGPAFPLEALRSKLLFSRADDDEEAMDDEVQLGDGVQGIVTASLLNIRNAPNRQAPTVASPLRQGTRITHLQTHDEWIKVKVETEGWVKGSFVKLVER